MAVEWIREQFAGRTLSKKLEKWVRDYKRRFLCKVTTKTDTPYIVLAYFAANGKDVGHIHPQDIGALCTDINISADAKDPELYNVELSYSSSLPDPDKQNEDPLLRPTIWSIDTETAKEYVNQDIDGRPLLNSAGDAFPPLEVPRSFLKLKAEKNKALADFNLYAAQELIEKINDAEWLGFPVNSVKLDSISANEQYENGAAYWKCNYSFTVKIRKLDDGGPITYIGDFNPVRQLDKGFNAYKNEDDAKPQQIMDSYGRPKSKETLLNGAGFVLPEDDDPVYLDFIIFEEADFDDLGLSS